MALAGGKNQQRKMGLGMVVSWGLFPRGTTPRVRIYPHATFWGQHQCYAAKKNWPLLKTTFSEFGEDKVLQLSAALAYYAMFSLGPLLVIAVGLAGLAFGHESVRRQIGQQLQGMVGDSSAKMVDSMMSARKHGTSVITTVVGILALLFGATGVFGQLQDALNTIWGVKAKPGAGIWGLIRARLLSFSMVLGIGFLLLISMALTTFLTAVSGSLGSMLGVSEALAHILNFVVSFAVISLLFAMIFKFLPDVKVPWRKVWVAGSVPLERRCYSLSASPC